MAKRTLKPRHQDEIRDKIRGSQLLNVIQSYALKGSYRGKPIEAKRIDAALGLLRKLVPDLSSQEITDKREGWIEAMKRLAGEDAAQQTHEEHTEPHVTH